LVAAGVAILVLSGCSGTMQALDDANRRLSAEAGIAQEQYEMGVAHLEGDGVPKDPEKALHWFERAAENGHPEALYLTARTALDDPASSPAQRKKAWGRLEAAAELGQEDAIAAIAPAYAAGGELPKDEAWAARWYGKAAQAGRSDAQVIMASRFLTGTGVPKDPGRSYGWLLVAAQGGSRQVEASAEKLAAALDEEGRAAGERFAKSYHPARPPRFSDQATLYWLQQALKKRGYAPGPVDGYLGPRTKEAVSAFRRDHGLEGSALDEALIEALRS
jgi:TPR repeat protein